MEKTEHAKKDSVKLLSVINLYFHYLSCEEFLLEVDGIDVFARMSNTNILLQVSLLKLMNSKCEVIISNVENEATWGARSNR